jgi:hypothetical protein
MIAATSWREELADAIDRLSEPFRRQDGNTALDADGEPVLVPPEAITIDMITKAVEGTETAAWIIDRRNRRIIPHRLEKCGYEPVRNDTADDTLWKIGGKRQVVYAHNSLSTQERISAARNLIKTSRGQSGR